MLFLAQSDLVELRYLLLVFLVDPLFTRSDFCQLLVEVLSRLLEHLPHIRIYVCADVAAHLFDQLVVAPAFFNLFRQVAAALFDHELHVFFNRNEVHVNAIKLCPPVNRIKSGLNY